MNRIQKIVICIIGLTAATGQATFFGINMLFPWNINLRPERWSGKPFQLTAYIEEGFKNTGYDADNHSVNPLQIWTPRQDALAMLQGFPADSPETNYYENILMSPVSDGERGTLIATGDFDYRSAGAFAWRYNFEQGVTIAAFLPFYSMKLSNVAFLDQTPDTTAEDMLIRQDLTNNIFQSVALFDPSLNLRGWSRRGVGDLAFTAEWLQAFPQRKEYLKEVDLNLRAGVTVPTGLRAEVNDILSVPFGFDGSWSFFVNGGIICNWFNHIRGGVDFLFLHLFGNIRERRIKVQEDQTDFLLLAKARAHTDYGFTQRYNLFAEAYHVFHGLSITGAYQFWRHAEDKLTLTSDLYSTAIANSAQSLEEWNLHQFFVMLKYNFFCDVPEESFFNPEIMAWYRTPVGGKRSIMASAYGLQLTMSF